MRTTNPLLRAFYSALKPPGHPVHLKHIRGGSWSAMDSDTIRYHLRKNEESLAADDLATLREIISKRECRSERDVQALQRLEGLVDSDVLHLAPGFFNYAVLLMPLLAGVLSILVLGSGVLRGDFNAFEISAARKKLSELSTQIAQQESEIESLEARNEDLALKVVESTEAVPEILGALLPELLSEQVPRVILGLGEDGRGEEGSLSLLSRSIDANRLQLETLLLEIQSLAEKTDGYSLIGERVGALESLVAESPEAVVSLRLLQREVADLVEEVEGKVDTNILAEKERRLQEGISKEVAGLSRELGILRWVVYLLVIGLTASGGIIVAMQRSRQ